MRHPRQHPGAIGALKGGKRVREWGNWTLEGCMSCVRGRGVLWEAVGTRGHDFNLFGLALQDSNPAGMC